MELWQQFSQSGTLAGVPGSRGYFFGVGLPFKQIMAVLCPCLLWESTVLQNKQQMNEWRPEMRGHLKCSWSSRKLLKGG